jgi:hypothetical protein
VTCEGVSSGRARSAGFFSDQTVPAGKRMTALVLRQPSGAILSNDTTDFQGLYNHLGLCGSDSSANSTSHHS